ncbi:trigger factor [Serpentinicella alkaliphila]|uniref:Trigger factor n=1 Tax=Serpentinicella alkaliphila TaxID=1734049 RepID=A0A4R2TJA7_9FIRM|nr:trigger factor [Serpentinicella alkaliphila]QUH24730.1 trigger factor [Serpentinicella alkaliphila]TCQ03720.1 trigger factor [Serpentinicella alkaliphila]
MSSEIIKKEDNKITLKIVVDAAKFEEATNIAYNKMKARFNMPGFRKGKAPKKIIEASYGVEIFYEEAINICFPDAYEAALAEHSIEPIDHPHIDIVDEIEKGKDVVFTAEVEIMPEFTIENYKGIEVEKKEYNVQEEDVQNELDMLVQNSARMVSVEDRPVKNGDMVIIDFKGMVDDVQFPGGTAEKQTLTIGSGHFIPGFEEQLIGANIGDDVVVNVTFPEKYHSEDLAGKDAVFHVKIHEIKEKELPTVDDEFAKDVSDFDTIEELKADIKNKLVEAAENKEKQEFENAVINAIASKVELNVPNAAIEKQIDQMIREFAFSLSYQGMKLETYYQITGTNEEDLRSQMREDAANRVKNDLVVDKISKLENIEVTEEDLNAEFEKMATLYKQEVEALKSRLKEQDINNIRDNLVMKKTVDFLVDNAKVI